MQFEDGLTYEAETCYCSCDLSNWPT